ncbi:MAG: hypothetical protein HC882_06510 [Acidobacteria bacterium]|nr:hypothetical protein [Acidobacteriota bacterium]
MREARVRRLVILGAGSFGEEIADIAASGGAYDVVAFIEGRDRSKCGQGVRGTPVVWIDEAGGLAETCVAVCAVGSTARGAFIAQAVRLGFGFATVVHGTAHVSASAVLGPGTVVSPAAVIGAHSRVGAHVLVNRGALIGHHASIGEACTISPGANIAGRTSIGDRVYVGMGALVLDGLSIGDGAVVGAGAVVTRDVPADCQVLGVPARVVKQLAT